MNLPVAYGIKKRNMKARGGMIAPKEALERANNYMLKNEDLVKENEISMAEGGEVKSMAQMIAEKLKSPMGYGKDVEEYMPPRDMAKSILAKKMAEGGMVSGDEAIDSDDDLFPLGESELHETPGQLMEDGEHEVEGMGEKRELMKKGLMSRILGSVRLKNMGR